MCEDNGGSLASIRSTEENSWIVDTFLPSWDSGRAIYIDNLQFTIIFYGYTNGVSKLFSSFSSHFFFSVSVVF